jgi:hypothetical protein
MRRLRLGELDAAIGAAGLLALLFLPWFGARRFEHGWTVYAPLTDHGFLGLAPDSGWRTLGWLTLLFCIAAIAAADWLLIATAIDRPVAQQVAACVLTATAGTLATVVVALRVLVFQPGDNATTTLRPGAWLGLLAALLIAGGGWWAIKDERTDAHESAYTPPPPRPAPPARS